MPITSQQLFRLTTIRSLVIDCKKASTRSDIAREVDHLLEWMSTHRDRCTMHVTLRFATCNAFGRKLKSRLQALGCVVTMKTVY